MSAAQTIHATAVVIGEWGVLILGPSGAGKSALALALIEAAAARGRFARLVGDDRVLLACWGDRLVARGHPAIAGLIEVRGEGLVRLPHAASAVVRLAVTLEAETPPRMPHVDAHVMLCGLAVPRLAFAQDGAPESRARRILAHVTRAG